MLSSKSKSVNHMIKSRSLNEKQRNKWDDTKVENNEIIFKIFYWPHKLKTFIIIFQINFLKKSFIMYLLQLMRSQYLIRLLVK